MAYIGASPSNGIRRKYKYTATAAQTSFTNDDNGITVSYVDSLYVDVFQNGVKLAQEDYTSTTGTSVVLVQAASADDIIEIIVFDVFGVADTVSQSAGGSFAGNVAMAGTLGVTGNTTVGGTLGVTGNTTVGGTFGVTGVSTLSDNIVFGAASKGVYLGVTSATASNLLDDYEEGTWTPAVTFGGAAVGVAYTANTNGRYVKVGGVVYVSGCLFLSNKGSSTGAAVITGLPFAHLNGSEGTKASASFGQINISFSAFPSMLGSGSVLDLYDTTTGGTLAALDNSNFGNASSVYFNASYATA
jgi:hypothetical protein